MKALNWIKTYFTRIFRYRRANKLAKKKAAQIKNRSLALIQVGSSLRIRDFAPYSDVDLTVVYTEEPEKTFTTDYEQGIKISMLQKSKSDFLEGLERGNPFLLTALKYGKVLWGKDWIDKLKKKDFSPKRFTFEIRLQSALNHYSDLLRGGNFPVEFYNACYHSYREFCRYLILKNQGRLVEGDLNIKKALQKMPEGRQMIEKFWYFRRKRLFPPRFDEFEEYMKLEELLEHELYKEIKTIETIGEKVFKIEGLCFPSLERLKDELAKKGYNLSLSSPMINFLKRRVLISGKKEELEFFCFDMKDGSLARS